MVKVIGGTTVERPTLSVTVIASVCFPSVVMALPTLNAAPSSVAATVYGSEASTTCSATVTSFAVIEPSFGETTVTVGGIVSTKKGTGAALELPTPAPARTAGVGLAPLGTGALL